MNVSMCVCMYVCISILINICINFVYLNVVISYINHVS